MFIFGILIHELGHLIGGIVSGYHFLFLEVLGIMLERRNGKFKLKRVPMVSLGQCIMYHENVDKCAIPLVTGGIILNAVFGIAFIVLFFLGRSFWFVVRILFLSSGLANMSLALINLFGSKTSDGVTLKEILYSNGQMKLYNTIMLAYSYMDIENESIEIPDELAKKLRKLVLDCEDEGRNTGLMEEAFMILKRRKNGFSGESV